MAVNAPKKDQTNTRLTPFMLTHIKEEAKVRQESPSREEEAAVSHFLLR